MAGSRTARRTRSSERSARRATRILASCSLPRTSLPVKSYIIPCIASTVTDSLFFSGPVTVEALGLEFGRYCDHFSVCRAPSSIKIIPRVNARRVQIVEAQPHRIAAHRLTSVTATFRLPPRVLRSCGTCPCTSALGLITRRYSAGRSKAAAALERDLKQLAAGAQTQLARPLLSLWLMARRVCHCTVLSLVLFSLFTFVHYIRINEPALH